MYIESIGMKITWVHWCHSSSLLLLVAAGMLVADRDSTLITVHRSNRPLCRYASLFQPHSKALRLHRSLTQELGESDAKWENGWVDILCLYHGRASKVGFQFPRVLTWHPKVYKHMRWIWVLRFWQAHALNGICPGHIETIFSLFFLTRVPKSYPIPFQLHFTKQFHHFFCGGEKKYAPKDKKKTPISCIFFVCSAHPRSIATSHASQWYTSHVPIPHPSPFRSKKDGRQWRRLNIANTTK